MKSGSLQQRGGVRVRGSPKRFDSVVAADKDSVSASEDGSGCVAGRESYNGVSSLHTHLGYLVVGERRLRMKKFAPIHKRHYSSYAPQ